MATIAGVTVTFGLPENDGRRQLRSLGQASDGSFKFLKIGASERIISIPLNNLTTSVKNSLITALEADANYIVTIAPDSHVDLGAGSGTSITAQWIDNEWSFVKNTHDSWSGILNFVRVT